MTEQTQPSQSHTRRNCWVFEGYFCRPGCAYKHAFGLFAKIDPNLPCALSSAQPAQTNRSPDAG